MVTTVDTSGSRQTLSWAQLRERGIEYYKK
jgi:hypothetical protein